MIAFFVLLICLTILFIGAGVVILLIVINCQSKRNGKGGTAHAVTPMPAGIRKPVVSAGMKDKNDNTRQGILNPGLKFFQGTAALIIGVVFVVLAGLIFATTTWHTLPNFSKVIMIFGFSAAFFGVSQIAGRVFKIEKTSQAFYILGSLFLFLTVLAAGYFKLLGEGFTMTEQHRFKVLCAGSLVTELALGAGIKRYKDKIYTKACFWGMSVFVFFFIKSLGLGMVDSIKVMTCYSALLMLTNELTKNTRTGMPSYMNADFTAFAGLHFYLFHGLMAWVTAAEWLGFIIRCIFYGKTTISILTVLTLGMMVLAITVMTIKKRRQYLLILHSISMIVCLHFLGLCIHTDFIYQLSIGAVLTAAWFFLKRSGISPLSSGAGEWIDTAVLTIDTMVLLLIALINWDSMSELLTASTAVIILIGIFTHWSSQHIRIRSLLPLLFIPMTITAKGILVQADITFFKYQWVVFLFLAAAVAWDLIKRDCFCISIMVMGTAAQLLFWLAGGNASPTALLLSGYLFIRSGRAAGAVKRWHENGGCIYLLAGVFFTMDCMTEKFLFQMIVVIIVFAAEYTVLNRFRKAAPDRLFWEVTGSILLMFTLGAFYLDDSPAWGYLVSCMVIFIVFYGIFYRKGSGWSHLLAAGLILPMPMIAAYRYALTTDQLYGFTAVVILISGGLTRRYVPIIMGAGDGSGKVKFDWFHILVGVVLLPMMLAGNEGWRSAYLVLLALYILQYAAVERLRQGALTTAAVLILLGYWSQPFVRIPELIRLEVQLVPAVLFTWYVAYVWKDRKDIVKLKTVLFCLSLTALLTGALYSGLVVDALILEVVCLAVFIRANIKKDVFWLRISGTIIVAVALYMTKDFWLSLSWWAYLLAAGLGLIIFAAVNEVKKQ